MDIQFMMNIGGNMSCESMMFHIFLCLWRMTKAWGLPWLFMLYLRRSLRECQNNYMPGLVSVKLGAILCFTNLKLVSINLWVQLTHEQVLAEKKKRLMRNNLKRQGWTWYLCHITFISFSLLTFYSNCFKW